jgi:hypothetical protein
MHTRGILGIMCVMGMCIRSRLEVLYGHEHNVERYRLYARIMGILHAQLSNGQHSSAELVAIRSTLGAWTALGDAKGDAGRRWASLGNAGQRWATLGNAGHVGQRWACRACRPTLGRTH